MASKCDKCEKLANLQAKYDRLEMKYYRLAYGEPVRKVHFDLDGYQTACGRDYYESDVDITDDIKNVTCGNCHSAWKRLKARWEKEQKEDEENGRLGI